MITYFDDMAFIINEKIKIGLHEKLFFFYSYTEKSGSKLIIYN